MSAKEGVTLATPLASELTEPALDRHVIFDARGVMLASAYRKDWAEAIVLACNSHAQLQAERDGMRAALAKCVAQLEDLEEYRPVYAGCIECTAGTTPNNRNTGLCGYHDARALLTLAGKDGV